MKGPFNFQKPSPEHNVFYPRFEAHCKRQLLAISAWLAPGESGGQP